MKQVLLCGYGLLFCCFAFTQGNSPYPYLEQFDSLAWSSKEKYDSSIAFFKKQLLNNIKNTKAIEDGLGDRPYRLEVLNIKSDGSFNRVNFNFVSSIDIMSAIMATKEAIPQNWIADTLSLDFFILIKKPTKIDLFLTHSNFVKASGLPYKFDKKWNTRFPSCELQKASELEKDECATQKLLAYIKKKLAYPFKAYRDSIEGKVLVQFEITKEGAINTPKIIEYFGYRLGRQVARSVQSMNRNGIYWKAQSSTWNSIWGLVNLEVAFKLDGSIIPMPPPPPPPPKPKPKEEEIFKVVEHMPRFPGCENMAGTDKEKQECANEKLAQFIERNIQYPKMALDNQTAGVVVIQFVVDKNGSVINIKAIKDPGDGLGDEVARVIELMNTKGLKWSGQRARGRPVKVQFNLPIQFYSDGRIAVLRHN